MNLSFRRLARGRIGMRKLLLVLPASVLLTTGPVDADDVAHTNVLRPDSLQWKVNPAFPKGVKIATLMGNPTKPGDTVVLRIKLPPNFQMPPHTHPYSEVVTIISGQIGTHGGERVDKVGGLLEPGSMWVYPAKYPHYAWTGPEQGVLQVQFTAPGGIDYVNPADDPRKNQ